MRNKLSQYQFYTTTGKLTNPQEINAYDCGSKVIIKEDDNQLSLGNDPDANIALSFLKVISLTLSS